jgi:hypothetical protein
VRIASSRRALVAALSLAALAATTTAVPAAATKPAGPTSGTGTVFFINPVQSTGNQNLTDNNDADSAEFASAYKNVDLTDLDGTGYLDGAWVNVRSTTGDQAYSPTGVYNYNRSDDRFEQVMAYYWVTAAQDYIQGLGFGTGELRAVNKESQDVRINQWGADNSYSWDKHDVIRLGKGGVDDAEDGEVIVHEYGHAVHDSQVFGFGSSLDAGSIGEGFGDYLAVTVGLAVAGAPAAGAPAGCVADWDSVSYTATAPHCLRRVDRDIKLADRHNQVHYDGQIWSRALWDIRNALGARTADRIIINAQFDFAPDTSFGDAADATVATAQEMYGNAAAKVVRKAFTDRGISVS